MGNTTIDRRDFLKGTAATLALLLSADGLSVADVQASEDDEAPVPGPPVKIGVIGLGKWGKETVSTLSRVPSAQVVAICDTYEPFVKRAGKIAESAATFSDYRKLLECPGLEAVVVATPTHLHKDIVLAALQAGKHVYCESPMASSLDDARAIAKAGQSSKQVFQAGQQGRSNLMYEHVRKFVKSGVLGNTAQLYAQWNKRTSWRVPARTREREKEVNWRLDPVTSTGLIGEAGIHWIDLANWYLGRQPVSASGFGNVMAWQDGRDVPDTVQCIIEYPDNVRMVFCSTLASSFSNAYMLFQGDQATLAVRENRGWMVKEADSPLLGWEVYAMKQEYFDETAICMIPDATKILKEGKEPAMEGSVEPSKEAHYCALENFTRSVRETSEPVCGPAEGYQAAVVAIKANEAVRSGEKVGFQDEWFDI